MWRRRISKKYESRFVKNTAVLCAAIPSGIPNQGRLSGSEIKTVMTPFKIANVLGAPPSRIGWVSAVNSSIW